MVFLYPLIRTEAAHCVNQAQLDTYKADGIEYVEWSAGKDERMCKKCGRLHGRRFKVSKAPTLAHPRCRCTLIPVIPDDWTADKKPKTVDNGAKSGIMEMNRQTKNIGVFAELEEYMSKKHIRNVAAECGIDLKGLSLSIDKNEELLRIFIAGRADYEHIGRITFFPNAFRNKEELVRTIYHEKIHMEQYKKYGVQFVQNNNVRFEEEAYMKEEEFIKDLKERGIL